jgi:hypothetical protein
VLEKQLKYIVDALPAKFNSLLKYKIKQYRANFDQSVNKLYGVVETREALKVAYSRFNKADDVYKEPSHTFDTDTAFNKQSITYAHRRNNVMLNQLSHEKSTNKEMVSGQGRKMTNNFRNLKRAHEIDTYEMLYGGDDDVTQKKRRRVVKVKMAKSISGSGNKTEYNVAVPAAPNNKTDKSDCIHDDSDYDDTFDDEEEQPIL